MNKFFIVAIFGLMQLACVALDSNKDESGATAMPQVVLPTGEIIPGYENHEDFKKEHTEQLLGERLKILCDFRNSYNSWSEEVRCHHKGSLKRNEIVLGNNATPDELKQIFAQGQITLMDHMTTVAVCLQKKFSDSPVKQKSMDKLITKIQSWKAEGKGDMQLIDVMPQSTVLQIPQASEDVQQAVAGSEPQQEMIQRERQHSAQFAPVSLMEAWQLSAPNIKIVVGESPVALNIENAMSDAEERLSKKEEEERAVLPNLVETLRTQLPILQFIKFEMAKYNAEQGQKHPLWVKYPRLWENL